MIEEPYKMDTGNYISLELTYNTMNDTELGVGGTATHTHTHSLTHTHTLQE